MKRSSLLLTVLTFVLMCGCSQANTRTEKVADHSPAASGEVAILQSWQGDYPVAQFKLLPEKQREKPVGFIDDAKTFENVWKAFKPGEATPEVDFKTNIILFTQNTQFYDRTSSGRMNVTNVEVEWRPMNTIKTKQPQRR